MRNATVTTVAPTGTISIIAGTTSGIEPLYAVAYVRNVLGGEELLEVNPLFEVDARGLGLLSTPLLRRVLREGSLARIAEVPEELRRVYVTAQDVPPDWHVRMQAAFQRWCDNGVSKTVNLPPEATQADVRRVYLLAWELKCKGITVFRSGSKSAQVLAQPSEAAAAIIFPHDSPGAPAEYPLAGTEFGGDCRTCAT
jgi:ribonucleoside-diphosphate reductase alpha chain